MKDCIVIHHSATEDSGTVSWDAIRKYHMETNGWKDIGYHYGVEDISGAIYALVGRDEQSDAAAVKEEHINRRGLHICCVGNYDKRAPSQAMLNVLIDRLILPLIRRHGISVMSIYPHRQFAVGLDGKPYKTCPGKKFDIEALKKSVLERMTK